MATARILKRDSFGTVKIESVGPERIVVRDTRSANWWAQGMARYLARRESRALLHLGTQEGLPTLIAFTDRQLSRSYLPGVVMHEARPTSRSYYRRALRLLLRLHRSGIAHNDLAKEANWLCMPGDRPAMVDFQLAFISHRRGKLFRLLAREDLRHLLKHKRHYLPTELTSRQRALLANPSLPARLWRWLIKPPYVFFTRRILSWPERHGPEERL